MTNTRAITAAAGVIHACVQQGKSLPASIAYALDSAGLLNSPEHAAEVAKLRTDLDECQRRYTEDTAKLKARVAELEALVPYREVWSSELPPGGLVCSVCGQPVESEPCPEHAPQGTADEDPIAYALTPMAGQREDAYTSPLHHDYKVPHDLPEPYRPFGEPVAHLVIGVDADPGGAS